MGYYLKLKFQNAKLFRTNKGTKDKSFSIIEGNKDRKGLVQFAEPITVFQISNMLHCLFGERPVPSHRHSFYSKSEYLFKKAEDSMVTINNYTRLNTNTNKTEFIGESFSTKKAVYNSYNANAVITWSIVKRYCGEHFDWVLGNINTILNDETTKFTFVEVVNKLRLDTSDKTTLFNGLKNRRLTAIYSYYLLDKNSSDLTKKFETALTIVNGIEKVVKLSGEVIVPINKDDMIKLQNSKGTAKILDGGLVYIDEIIPRSQFEYEEDKHILVSTISTKKIKFDE